jgi:hypothetical protein
MKIIDRIVEIALTNEHWFEKTPFQSRPEMVLLRARTLIGWDYPMSQLTVDTYAEIMRTPVRPGATPRTWRRHRKRRLGRAPTDGDVNAIASLDHSVFWRMVTDDWDCPCCRRRKIEIIQPSGQFAVSFGVIQKHPLRGMAASFIVCNECSWAMGGLSKEAGVNYRSLMLDDVRDVIVPEANASHGVKPDPIVDAVIERIRNRAGNVARSP